MTRGVIVLIGAVVYIAVLFVIVAIYKSRASKDADSFATANRSISVLMLTTMVMSVSVASTAVLGTSDQGAAVGLSGAWFTWTGGLGMICAGFLTAKWYRKQKIITVPEAFGNTWDKKTRMVSLIPFAVQGYIGYLCQIPLTTTVLAPLLGIDPQICYIVLPIVFIGLFLVAGVWGIAITSLINFAVLWIGVIIGLIVGVSNAGGFSSLSTLPQSYFNLGAPGVATIISWLVGAVFFSVYAAGSQVAGAKDERTAKRGLIYGGILVLIFGFIPPLLGMFTKVSMPEVQGGVIAAVGASTAIPFHTIMVMGVIAAIVSTVPFQLYMAPSVITVDLIKGYLKPDITPKAQLNCIRIIGAVLGLTAIPLAPIVLKAGIIPTIQKASQVAVFAAFVLLTHIYIRRVSKTAAFWSILIPAIVAVIWIIFPIWGWAPIYPAMIIGFPTMIVTMICFPAKSQKEPATETSKA